MWFTLMSGYGKGGDVKMNEKGLDVKTVIAGVTIVVTILKTIVQFEKEVLKEKKCIKS